MAKPRGSTTPQYSHQHHSARTAGASFGPRVSQKCRLCHRQALAADGSRRESAVVTDSGCGSTRDLSRRRIQKTVRDGPASRGINSAPSRALRSLATLLTSLATREAILIPKHCKTLHNPRRNDHANARPACLPNAVKASGLCPLAQERKNLLSRRKRGATGDPP
jgi:hypothetical protein